MWNDEWSDRKTSAKFFSTTQCTLDYFVIDFHVCLTDIYDIQNMKLMGSLPPFPYWLLFINTLTPRQNECQCAGDIFKCVFLNENVWIQIGISLKFVPKGPINNIPALVQIMAWCCPGNKPLSEPMMISLLMHICITRPQWVNSSPSSAAHLCQIIGVSIGSDNGLLPIQR